MGKKWKKIGENGNNKAQKNINFKNNAPFTSCISKINNIFIDNNEYLFTANISFIRVQQ